MYWEDEVAPVPTEDQVLLVDGDIACFQSASSADGRLWTTSDGTEFKYKKEADQYCEDHNLDPKATTQAFHPEPVSHAIHNLKAWLQRLTDKYKGYKVELYLTGNTNFRKGIFPEYKDNRAGGRVPEHLADCKQYLVNKHGAVVSVNCEADDLIATRSKSLGDKNCVVCTLDKDMDMIPGRHFNWTKGGEYIVSPEEGMRSFYRQLLTGDRVDNIPGLAGVGPAGAKKTVPDDLTEPYQMYKAVLEAYCDKDPVAESEALHEYYTRKIQEVSRNARLLWLQREPDEVWQPPLKLEVMEADTQPDESFMDAVVYGTSSAAAASWLQKEIDQKILEITYAKED